MSDLREHYSEVSATTDAKRAIADLAKHEAAADTARMKRDRAIHEMRDEGLKPPATARELGVSISLARLVLKMPKP